VPQTRIAFPSRLAGLYPVPMGKRVAAIVMLVIVAGLAAYLLLPGNNVHAPEVVATNQPRHNDPEPLTSNTEPDKTDTPQPTNTEATPDPPPGPETPSNAITFKGRLLWTPPCPHADFASLAGWGLELTLWGMDNDRASMWVKPNDVPVSPDGTFLFYMELTDEDRAKQLLLVTPGRRYEMRLDGEHHGHGDSARLELQPTITDLVVDFGDVDLTYSDFAGEDQWMIIGRLLSPNGESLGDQDQFDLLCARGSRLMPVFVKTDRQGWFVAWYSDWWRRSSDTDVSLPIQAAKWWMDIGNTSYIHEDTWRFEDALIEMPGPLVDESRHTVSFGEVRLDVSILEVALELSEAAEKALAAEGQEFIATCHFGLANGGVDYDFELRHDRKALLCVLPGRYSTHASFTFAVAATFDGDNHPTVVFPEHRPLRQLPMWADKWAELRPMVEIPVRGVRELTLRMEHVRQVGVYVETPEGAATTVDVCLTVHDGEERWGRPQQSVQEACPLPLLVRVHPGLRHDLEIVAAGCELGFLTIPDTGDKFAVRLEARPEVPVTVKFSPNQSTEFPDVKVRARRGPLEIERRANPGSGDVNFSLRPGSWTINVYPTFDTGDHPELCVEMTIEVKEAGENEFVLPELDWPFRFGSQVRVGETILSRGSAIVLRADGKRSWGGEFRSGDFLGIWDGGQVHTWHSDTTDGQVRELLLPERIRLKIPEALIDQLGEGQPGLVIRCWYEGGNCILENVGATSSLWAPPGECSVQLTGGLSPGIRQEWQVEVVPGKVIELTAPSAFGVLRATLTEPSTTDDDYRVRASAPNWRLIQLGESEEEVAAFDPWPDAAPLMFSVAAGEYELRAAYGPSAAAPIRFTVVEGQETALHLPVPESLPANGSVLLPLPEGFFGAVEADVEWKPTTPGHSSSGDYVSYSERCRIVDGKLLIHGLLIGEAMELTVEFACRDASGSKTWTATTAAFTLADSKQRDVAVTWTAK
jgi:hypothetical protein